MSRTHVASALREQVSADARHRYGYCLTREAVVGVLMEIEHIEPEALGGPTVRENLWLACSTCNGHKASRITAVDPKSGETVRLFDPRRQHWDDHFRWTSTGDLIVGVSPCGRATVVALHLNRPTLVLARRAWVSVGWHPPKD